MLPGVRLLLVGAGSVAGDCFQWEVEYRALPPTALYSMAG